MVISRDFMSAEQEQYQYTSYNENDDDDDNNKSWDNFIPFVSLPNLLWKDPNLRFVDLIGDGHADVLITENDQVFAWYPSLAEEGFGPAVKVRQASTG